jgi:hypothetical protein
LWSPRSLVSGSVWLIVVGLVGHGLKDLWLHRRQVVANTRWWPRFCVVVDWIAAALVAVAIITGVDLQQAVPAVRVYSPRHARPLGGASAFA